MPMKNSSHEFTKEFTQSIIIQLMWYDYIVIVFMVCISTGFGIYYGCFGKKLSTATGYLMGGKKLMVLPVAISLMAR